MAKKNWSTIVRNQAVGRWVIIAAVILLAGLDRWNWAWLVLAVCAFQMVADVGLGIVVALATSMEVQTQKYKTRYGMGSLGRLEKR